MRSGDLIVNVFLKMGPTGVLSTLFWHHLYLGGGVCELPETSPRPEVEQLSAIRSTAAA